MAGWATDGLFEDQSAGYRDTDLQCLFSQHGHNVVMPIPPNRQTASSWGVENAEVSTQKTTATATARMKLGSQWWHWYRKTRGYSADRVAAETVNFYDGFSTRFRATGVRSENQQVLKHFNAPYTFTDSCTSCLMRSRHSAVLFAVDSGACSYTFRMLMSGCDSFFPSYQLQRTVQISLCLLSVTACAIPNFCCSCGLIVNYTCRPSNGQYSLWQTTV